MKPAPQLDFEEDRLAALRRYHILDAPPEDCFDAFTRIASEVCNTPMSLISLIDEDRQWFLSRVGLETKETCRDISFCGHAIEHPDLLEIPDTLKEDRFSDNPLVTGPPHLRFYAGVPLRDPEGNALGTLCVLDTQPGTLTDSQKDVLKNLAALVVDRIVSRRRLQDLQSSEAFRNAILTSSLDAIVIIDQEGKVVEFNACAEDIFNYTRQETLGRPISELIVPPHLREAHTRGLQHYLATGEGPVLEKRIEITAVRKSGEEFDVELAITPIRFSQEIFFSAYLRDISERKNVEAELAKARDQEYQIAARIQKTLLTGPNQLKGAGYEIVGGSTPSKVVDGDFYDVFNLAPGWADLVLGDVMGKGVPAALLGAAAKTAIQRSISKILMSGNMSQYPDPCEIIASLHADLVPTLMDLDSFITLCYARIEENGKTLNFVNCGHPPLLLFHSDGSWEALQGQNMPLGFSQRQNYQETRVELREGDRLVCYSDGLTEARNREGTHYGESALIEEISRRVEDSPELILNGVFRAVSNYVETPEFVDDLTMMVVSFNTPNDSLGKTRYRGNFLCDLDHLEKIRKFLYKFLEVKLGKDTPAEFTDALVLATNEAVTNIFNHAYQGQSGNPLEVELSVSASSVKVNLIHEGSAFAGRSTQREEIDIRQDSGFGLFIMEQAVDRVEYLRLDDTRNAIVLEKYFTPSKENL